jgi:hypothetical protein
MRKKTEAEAVLKKCRGLIDEIIANLSAKKPLVNISSAAELLFYLELAASALKKVRSKRAKASGDEDRHPQLSSLPGQHGLRTPSPRG